MLVAVGQDRSNAEAGRQLYMSEATVKDPVSRVLTKLEATKAPAARGPSPRHRRATGRGSTRWKVRAADSGDGGCLSTEVLPASRST